MNERITYSNWLLALRKNSLLGSIIFLISIIYSCYAIFMKFYAPEIDTIKEVMLVGAIANLFVLLFAIMITNKEEIFKKTDVTEVVKTMENEGLYPNDDIDFSKKENFDSYVRLSENRFEKYWVSFLWWLLWLYVFLILFKYLPDLSASFHEIDDYVFGFVHTTESGDKEIKELGNFSKLFFPVILCFIFNVRSMYVYMCYLVLHNLKIKNNFSEENFKEKFDKSFTRKRNKFLLVVVAFSIVHLTSLCFTTNLLQQQINYTFFILSGIWGGFTMAMVATHFESRIVSIEISPFWISAILVYSTIHILMFALNPEIPQFSMISILIIVGALILKVHLFLFVLYLYQSGRMAAYFILMPILAKKIGNIQLSIIDKNTASNRVGRGEP